MDKFWRAAKWVSFLNDFKILHAIKACSHTIKKLSKSSILKNNLNFLKKWGIWKILIYYPILFFGFWKKKGQICLTIPPLSWLGPPYVPSRIFDASVYSFFCLFFYVFDASVCSFFWSVLLCFFSVCSTLCQTYIIPIYIYIYRVSWPHMCMYIIYIS